MSSRITLTKGRLTFTSLAIVSSFGSYYIAKYNVFDWFFSKLGWETPIKYNKKRMNLLLICILFRGLKHAHHGLRLSLTNPSPRLAIQIQLLNFVLDCIAICCVARTPVRYTMGSYNDYKFENDDLTIRDWIGAGINLFGAILEHTHDWMLVSFKNDPNNAGKPYLDIGASKYVAHPNYLGHLLRVFGLGILSQSNLYPILLFVMNFMNFKTAVIPQSQARNISKYGQEYQEYLKTVWNLMPGIW